MKHTAIRHGITTLVPALMLGLGMVSCAAKKADGPIQRSDFALNTVCTLTLLDGGSEKILDEAFSRLHELEGILSARRSDSDLMAVNQAAGVSPVKVPEELFKVVQQALVIAESSNYRFDPTIDPLSRLWDIQGGTERIPADEEISAALDLIGAGDVVLDQEGPTMYLRRPGMSLDLGGIAKGYAADELATLLARNKVKAAIVDLGGNIMTLGTKPDGSPWRIAVRNPVDTDGTYLGILELQGSRTMVTSGVYERFFIGEDGRRYHHILDTRTGRPVDNGLVAVTVLSTRSMDADGLSTALLALGIEEGLRLVATLEDVEALFVDERNLLYASAGMRQSLKLLDQTFSWADEAAGSGKD